MPRYAYMNEAGDTILREKVYPDPLDPAVMARKNILEIVVTDPPFDAATQIRTGPVDTIEADRIDRVFTVRNKTVPELDAEDDATSGNFFDQRAMKAFGLVMLTHLNALGDTTTAAELKTEFLTTYRGLRP